MAMGTRSRGLAASANRPRLTTRAVYEDFKPLMESKEDAEAHTVYIHLPGFLKEQIRIVAESSTGLLRVRGERLVSGHTCSRFLEEVPVPDNCDITETRAKYEDGVLRITMPKRITYIASQSSSPAGLSSEATTPERSPPAPPRPAPPPHPAPLRPVAPPLSQSTQTPRPLPPPRTPAAEPRPAALPPAPRPSAPLPPRMPEQKLTPSIQPKPRDDAKLKPSPPQPPRPTPPPHPDAPRFRPSIHPKPREDEKPRFEASQRPSLPLPPPPATKFSPPPGLLQALPQPDPAQMKDPIASEWWMTESEFPAPPKALVRTADSTAEAPKTYESLTEGEKRRMGMKGVSLRGLEEDRQLLVNIGAAAMVLVAFGAWISYSFSSNANPSN